MSEKRRVIIVTDGDLYAQKAIETVAKELGGRCISQSAGNPTPLAGYEIVSLIFETPHDPVFVMFDDSGFPGEGYGELAMQFVTENQNIEVLGAIAVASRTHFSEWTKVDVSIDRFGDLTHYGVDKNGFPDMEAGRIDGDTVSILDKLNLPIVVGVGDIGKMAGYDDPSIGSPITRKAVQILLERSGVDDIKSR